VNSRVKLVMLKSAEACKLLDQREEPHGTLVFLIAITGLRVSELLGLRWTDIDFEHRLIYIRRTDSSNDAQRNAGAGEDNTTGSCTHILAYHVDVLYTVGGGISEKCNFGRNNVSG
jgi:hypothetical protein